jgi:hypothetical protein
MTGSWRLQVAAETGQALGFAFRPLQAARNPSPAALRLALDATPPRIRVLKCRGGNPPAEPVPFPAARDMEHSLRIHRDAGPVTRRVRPPVAQPATQARHAGA